MTGKILSRVLIVAIACLAGAAGFAQGPATPVPSGAPGSAAPGSAADNRSVAQLRKDLRKAQDRFNAVYNKLAPREDRITCKQDANTGSRLAKRSCSTEKERDAAAQDALAYMSAMDQGSAQAGQSGYAANRSSPMEAAAAAAAPGRVPSDSDYRVAREGAQPDARQAYRANMEKLLAENFELRQALQEYTEIDRRYQAALKR